MCLTLGIDGADETPIPGSFTDSGDPSKLMTSTDYLRHPNRVTASTCPPATYEFHCFLSYTTREEEVRSIKPTVDTFAERLREAGITVCPVFYDGWYLERREYEIQDLADRLREGIARSAFTIAFLSPGYIESEWCRYEWRTTLELHGSRGDPAPNHSVFPVLWKKLPAIYFRPQPRRMLKEVERRMAWKGYGLVPNQGRVADISGLAVRDGAHSGLALWHALLPVPQYLDRWYPNTNWGEVEPFRTLY